MPFAPRNRRSPCLICNLITSDSDVDDGGAVVEILAVMAGSDCEQLRAGWLAQPANTVSCAAFLAVAWWLVYRAGTGADRRGVLLSGALAIAGVGVGSFVYHGPQPAWADPFHGWSVIGLAFVIIAQTISLLVRGSREAVLPAWKAAGGWMAAGLLAYVLGRTSSPFCRPETLLQSHAVWHVLVAIGLGRMVAVYAGS